MADDHNQPVSISETLSDLVLQALEHGMASRSDAAGVVPFALVECDGTRYIHRFAADTDEEAVADAMAFVAEVAGSPEACAIVYDGTITVEGTPFDAILVIGCERDAANSLVFAQRYDASQTPLVPIGSPAIIGMNESLLDTAS